MLRELKYRMAAFSGLRKRFAENQATLLPIYFYYMYYFSKGGVS